MAKSSCKGCDHRHMNCHSTCEDYKSFRKSKDEENERIRKAKEHEAMMDAFEIKRARRVRQWHGKK